MKANSCYKQTITVHQKPQSKQRDQTHIFKKLRFRRAVSGAVQLQRQVQDEEVRGASGLRAGKSRCLQRRERMLGLAVNPSSVRSQSNLSAVPEIVLSDEKERDAFFFEVWSLIFQADLKLAK